MRIEFIFKDLNLDVYIWMMVTVRRESVAGTGRHLQLDLKLLEVVLLVLVTHPC